MGVIKMEVIHMTTIAQSQEENKNLGGYYCTVLTPYVSIT